MAAEWRPRSAPLASDLGAEGTPALRTEKERWRVWLISTCCRSLCLGLPSRGEHSFTACSWMSASKAGAWAPAAASPARAGASPSVAPCSRHRIAPEQLPRTVSMVVSVVSCMAVIPQHSNYWSGPLWAKHCASTQWEQGCFPPEWLYRFLQHTLTWAFLTLRDYSLPLTRGHRECCCKYVCFAFLLQVLCKLGSKSCNERLNLQCSTR